MQDFFYIVTMNKDLKSSLDAILFFLSALLLSSCSIAFWLEVNNNTLFNLYVIKHMHKIKLFLLFFFLILENNPEQTLRVQTTSIPLFRGDKQLILTGCPLWLEKLENEIPFLEDLAVKAGKPLFS